MASLSEVEIDGLWALFQGAYDRVSESRFRADLADKPDILLLERADGRGVAGFSTLKVYEPEVLGRPERVLYSGDTVVIPEFWGDKALQAGFNRYLVRLVLERPRTPLWWMLTTKGFRTYLLLTNYFSESYPRCDLSIPPAVEQLRRELGARCYGADYDADAGIVRHAGRLDRVAPGLAPIGDRERQNPHIAYFERVNPRHADGDELLCLAHVRWRDPLRILARLVKKRF